jgi:hypothetical protein
MSVPLATSSVKQEFLTELESILESDEAYGSNIQVLIYAVRNDVINGKFKDSWNNRVYEFVIDVDGINYKPAAKLDSFNVDELPARFDSFSKGYGLLFADVRLDRNSVGKRVKKPKCGKEGYGCGFSCIGLTKTCRILSSGKKTRGEFQGKAIGKERLNKLIDLSIKLAASGDKKKFAAVNAVGARITSARNKYQGEGRDRLVQRQMTNKNKPIAAKTDIPIDRSLFDIKFPQKIEGASDSYESLVDRVNQAQAMAKGKDSYFKDANPSQKSHILRDMVEEYHGADVDYDKAIENAIKTGAKNKELYSRAAITRLQAARALWEDLPEKKKRIVARTLKYEEADRSLLTQKEKIKNPYIEELRKEFAKYIK